MTNPQSFGPLGLPSGRVITFRAPVGLDRAAVVQAMDLSPERLGAAALMMDELIAAKCVLTVDEKPVQDDYRRLFDSWPDADIQFYLLVHREMFGLTDEARQAAKDAARFLRSGSTSTGGSR
ncbi:MAG: hypothetical protein QME76_12430 [Bacillota bacterium]|nr:hypothetical protein [Bacillota bacterium]